MITPGEKVTVPNMNFILLSLLPLILVRKSIFPSLAAANGQFMFFNAKTYHELSPHEKMKSNMVEDIEIARYLKREMRNIACLTGDDSIKCRMYSGFADAVSGFSKNTATFFGNSLIMAILFWIVTTFGFLLVLRELSSFVFITYLIIYLTMRIMISWVSEQNPAGNLLYLIPQQVSCGLFIYHAFRNRILKRYTWKGREIKY